MDPSRFQNGFKKSFQPLYRNNSVEDFSSYCDALIKDCEALNSGNVSHRAVSIYLSLKFLHLSIQVKDHSNRSQIDKLIDEARDLSLQMWAGNVLVQVNQIIQRVHCSKKLAEANN